MHISDLAERAGVTVKAVRYYESRGLIELRSRLSDLLADAESYGGTR